MAIGAADHLSAPAAATGEEDTAGEAPQRDSGPASYDETGNRGKRGLAVQEKDFFTEKTESKPHTINCPSCRQAAEYQIRWIRRTKKPSLPPRATEEDRARSVVLL